MDFRQRRCSTCTKCTPPTFPPIAGVVADGSGSGVEVVAVDQSFLASVPEDY